MPATRLSRLLRREAPLPAEARESIHKLEQLAEQQPDLRELAATSAALLHVMYSHPLPLPHVMLDPGHATAKREAGLPLLRGEPVAFDAAGLRDQFIRLCRVMEDRGNRLAAPLRHAVEHDRFRVGDLPAEILAGDPAAVAARAADLDLDAGLATTLLRLALFPVMARLAEDLKPLLDDAAWRRGYCPVCGAWPVLGEYRGLELTRFLRCGLCAAEWEIDRLLCPVCNNRLHQDIFSLTAEGEDQQQRAVVCERCHSYVKQISTLGPIPASELLVADVRTIHLDLVAHARRYLPPL